MKKISMIINHTFIEKSFSELHISLCENPYAQEDFTIDGKQLWWEIIVGTFALVEVVISKSNTTWIFGKENVLEQ